MTNILLYFVVEGLAEAAVFEQLNERHVLVRRHRCASTGFKGGADELLLYRSAHRRRFERHLISVTESLPPETVNVIEIAPAYI